MMTEIFALPKAPDGEPIEHARVRLPAAGWEIHATLALRSFLFTAVYENTIATAEFAKARGILGGLWEKVRERPAEFLDARTLSNEGLDAAARDFLAGMTDRYAISLFERLFIPRPWVDLRAAVE